MNQVELRQLAEDRILDANALLAAQRWSGAYYLAGYAVECGLKSCVLGRIISTGVIFEDKRFGERCWTHDFDELIKLAELEKNLGLAQSANPAFKLAWQVLKDWNEASRYRQMTQEQAEDMYRAVTDPTNGVLPWIKTHW